jgi:hypothetical protein
MTNLENELNNLIENFGIEAVMNGIKSNHSSKVYIPQWYYQEHLEDMGYDFDEEYFDMCAFDEFMSEAGLLDVISESIQCDYLPEWEEYKENNS